MKAILAVSASLMSVSAFAANYDCTIGAGNQALGQFQLDTAKEDFKYAIDNNSGLGLGCGTQVDSEAANVPLVYCVVGEASATKSMKKLPALSLKPASKPSAGMYAVGFSIEGTPVAGVQYVPGENTEALWGYCVAAQ